MRLDLVLCVTSLALVTSQREADIFWPYGITEGDAKLYENDDGFSEPINLEMPFRFFATSYSTLYVNTNGVLSFNAGVPTFTPAAFPVADQPLIALFWADIDTRNGGSIFYREILEGDVLGEISGVILDVYAARGLYYFSATWAFIVTYKDVAKYGNTESPTPNARNTFQVVLATDGTHSFTIHNYGSVEWTYGTASHNTDAQVGFDAGDSVHFFAVPASRTPDILHIANSSNVDTPGRWIFRIDQETIDAGGCHVPGRCKAHEMALPNGTCQVIAPKIENCPELTGPVLKDNTYVYFYCEFTQTLALGDTFEIRFLFNNELDENVPVERFTGTLNTLPQHVKIPLHEKYLKGHLNSWISCEVQSSFYRSDVKSIAVQSEAYLVTVKPSAYEIIVRESDDVATRVHLTSTIPIPCHRPSDTDCHERFLIQSSDDLLVYQPGRPEERDDVTYNCAYYMYTRDWQEDESQSYREDLALQIVTVRTAFSEPDLVDYIRFSTEDSDILKMDERGNEYEPFWVGFEPEPIVVYRVDDDARAGATCAATGDPRVSLFDGSVYSMYATGQFIMVKSSSQRNFEVQIRTYECEQTLSCVCAVVVREGNESLALDMCDGSATPHRIIRSADDGGEQQGKISMSATGRSYTISMPSGAFVNVDTFSWGMNVLVHILGQDYNRTMGLCGNYNNNAADDFAIQFTDDVDSSGDKDAFVNSWRVPAGTSLFEVDPDPFMPVAEPVTNFCPCSIGQSNELVPCGNIVQSDSFSYLMNDDLTVQPFITNIEFGSGGRRRKRSSDAERRHQVDTSYDPFSYVYAENTTNIRQFDWPTASGIEEEDARRECAAILGGSCDLSEPITGLSMAVEKCVLDVKETDSYDWIHDKVSEAQFTCLHAVIRAVNVTLEEDSGGDGGATARAQIAEAVREAVQEARVVMCPAQCSGHGRCVDSLCQCERGWEGQDCSVDSSSLPDVQRFVGDNLCDTFSASCDSVTVILESAIFLTGELACRIEVEESGQVLTREAFIQGAYSVRCPLPETERLFKQLGSGVLTYRISVTRDGTEYGEYGEYRVFSGECVSCQSPHRPCFVQNGTCSIGGVCYRDGEENPEDDCQACISELHLTSWSASSSECDTSGSQGAFTQISAATVMVYLSLACFLRALSL